MIEHKNIVYISNISEIGGVETFVYELVKKYQDLDIAVVYKYANAKQLKKLKQLCRTYKHTNQIIKCSVIIINYDISIIDYIDENADIYQVIHADYANEYYKELPPTHKRIKEYIGITNYIVESFKKLTGNENVILGYNPLTIEKENYITLVSATRLSKIKGKERMYKLAKELDLNKIKYIWYVFTNDTYKIENENIIYMKPRLDVSKWIEKSDYVVQLSDTEACSYTINEALFRNIPVIVTPLPYLEEIGYKDGQTGYTLKFDCSNIKEVVSKIKNIPKFHFDKLEDNYKNIFINSKNKYKEERFMKVKVKVLETYDDIELSKRLKKDSIIPGEEVEEAFDLERAEYLKGLGLVEIIGKIEEEQVKQDNQTSINQDDNFDLIKGAEEQAKMLLGQEDIKEGKEVKNKKVENRKINTEKADKR